MLPGKGRKDIRSRGSGRHTFHSLRTRIIVLALFATLLLVAAGASFYFFLNSSQRTKLESTQRHLIYLAGAMRNEYGAQLVHGFSLQSVKAPLLPPPPPPPPGVPERPPKPPLDETTHNPLTTITTSVLRHESDVEGGFYSSSADVLTGYAFPTHEGPGGRQEIPGKERPEIEQMVRAAASTGTLQKKSFHGAYDAILFVAIPIQDGQRTTGAVWLMQRMPGLESGRSKQLLLGSLGFAAAAVVCAFLTFFITSEVSKGVQTVLARLGSMEGALGEHPEDTRPQLAEFEQVLKRVDALSDSLKQKIETQRALEDEVRHRQRLSALGQFAAGVAHELRNPLATIRLRAQMSQRATDLTTVERSSTVVLSEVDRLNDMIERLLYFSRPIRLQLQPTSLSQLCRETLEIWQARCQDRNVRLESKVGEGLSAICDASKVRQVLENLLENALQSVLSATEADRSIQLRGRREGVMVLLEVCDNGAGLDGEAEAHALEPFFTTKDAGTGLGLSISYEIMQAHGGDLKVGNILPAGAVVTLSLPAETATLCEPTTEVS